MSTPDPEPRLGLTGRIRALVAAQLRLVVLCSVAGALLFGVFGYFTARSYTAETRLLVGSFEAPAAAIPGYVLASQTVAANYARLADSAAVIDKVPEDLAVSRAQILADTGVTAVPESAIIRVVATGDSVEAATTSSEAMANALNEVIAELNAGASGDELLAEFQPAAETLAAANAELAAAQSALTAAVSTSGAGSQAVVDASRAVADASLAQQTAQLRVDGLRTRYQTEQASVSTSSQARLLGGAEVSRKSRTLPTLVHAALGALLGLVVGVALAWMVQRSRLSVAGTGPDGDDESASNPNPGGAADPTGSEMDQVDSDSGAAQ